MKKEILIKFLNNQCDKHELDEIIQWANNYALNNESKGWGKEIWDNSQENNQYIEDEKLDILFEKIQSKIRKNTPTRKVNTPVKEAARYITWFTKVAAILIFPILGLLLYTMSENYKESAHYSNLMVDSLEIVAPIGSRTVVQLSDGSEVHLNYGSSLKYPQFFTGNSREVILSGEGYFDVAHNPKKPFIVKTGKLNVKALGTAFNVTAYPDEQLIETTLVNGKVVLIENSNHKLKTIGAMVPGQHVDFNTQSGEVYSTEGDVEKYISWTQGKQIFEDAPISYVTQRLSRMYNVDFAIAENVKDYIYTVTFVDEPLYQILDLMTIATPIKYNIVARNKLIDGSFSKQKIVIEKK